MPRLVPDVLSFAAVAGLLTIVPGLDTAMVLRSAATHGRLHGFATALGVKSGAYTVVRIAGAAYMLLLGSRLVLHALRPGRHDPAAQAPSASLPGLVPSWSRGLTTNLLNPKIGAFYVAILPQFIPPHASHLAVGLLLALVHDLEGLIWFSGIILATHSVRTLLHRRRARRTIDGVTGATLIGFGIKLGLSAK